MSKRFNTTLLDFQCSAIPRKIKGLRRNPYMLKLSKEINIAKLKHLTQLSDLDCDYDKEKKRDFKNIGFAVTEKRRFPCSSICEVTILSNHRARNSNSPLSFLESYYSNRRNSNPGQRRKPEISEEKILSTKLVKIEVKDPEVFNKTVFSAYECFRPTRLIRRRVALDRYLHIRKISAAQSPYPYNNCVSIQTDESHTQESI